MFDQLDHAAIADAGKLKVLITSICIFHVNLCPMQDAHL